MTYKNSLKNTVKNTTKNIGKKSETMSEETQAPARKSLHCDSWPSCKAACPLVRLSYKEQLAHKFKKVRDAFIKEGFSAASLASFLKPTRSAPKTLGYRNKAKWILDTVDGKIRMGIYRAGTHEILDISHCLVHAPAINGISNFIRDQFELHNVPCGPLDPKNPTVRYMIVRYSFREQKLLVVFVTSGPKIPGLDAVVQAVEANEEWSKRVVAFVQNINADAGNVLLGEANRFMKKKAELTETLGLYRVPVGPLSFLQVNSVQASHLYQRVKELIGRGPFEAGLDLYSGVGLIAMHLAPVTKRILAVEEVGPAALEAITAARRNKINNILELCADSLEGIHTFVNEWGAPDWIVLNPPRKGCDEKVLATIIQKPPRKLVYVSCNPSTLARDLLLLLNGCPDLSIKTIEPVDMFPQTEHVECLALLENRNFKKSTKKVSEGNPRKSSSKTPSRSRPKAMH